MAQKVVGFIKLQIPAGKATPAPPVGPALGQHGVNIMAFTKEFNERTKNDMGMIIPVVITVYADRSFTFVTKTPPAAVLIKERFGCSEQDEGRKNHERADSQNRGNKNARFERFERGIRNEHDRRNRAFHGRYGRRLMLLCGRKHPI